MGLPLTAALARLAGVFAFPVHSAPAPLPRKTDQELVNGTKKWGINPERFAPGHGTPAPYAPLVRLVEGL